jgi:hypothetical protein
MNPTRRLVTAGLSAAALLAAMRPAMSAQPTKIVVTKDPNCGCCTGWVEHLRSADFAVEVIDTAELNRVKRRLKIPADLSACHTAEVSGYVIEGHVPAPAIRRLLSERPRAIGLAVPGMPTGSPGMEVPGSPPEDYDVILFGPQGRKTYARFNGAKEIPAN